MKMMKLKEIMKMHPFMFVGLENSDNMPTINIVVNAIVKGIGIDFAKLQSPSRKREIVDARHLFCYFARKRSDLSYQAIGDIINRDHATVIHGIRKVEQLLANDRDFKEIVPKINILIRKYERVAAK